ncbi:type II secretion system protein GspJ [Chondromyces apiculatus]|uniref:Type II secretion system protein J n=1 Tax=Chondromyces apiculatus DSM 436 TaxID=1192034 RepID=A0A017T117_9BACT|nr:type II secretion system protein GspJ [Chondromyces apiculatus]EYF02918.1 General secretion pathway protein J [Chondromyces apiculatus DSM 436]
MSTPRVLSRRRRRASAARRGEAGLTLVEVLISISILALIGTLIYGAFDGMNRTRRGIGQMSDRYHQGRQALSRVARELQTAFLSRHMPLDQNYLVRKTIFIAEDSSPADRVDFTAFAHRRLMSDAHESDQTEIGFFAVRDPEQRNKLDLVRRESKFIDLEPERGGVVNVLAEDIDSFSLQYFDPMTGEWTDSWDSSQVTGQYDRLPLQVWITLVLRGGPGGQLIKFETKVPIAMQVPLGWADQNPNTSSQSQNGGVQSGNDVNSALNSASQGGLSGGMGNTGNGRVQGGGATRGGGMTGTGMSAGSPSTRGTRQ